MTFGLAVLLAMQGQDLSSLTQLRDVQTRRESSHNKDDGSNVDFQFIKPGETLTLADVTGPGTIKKLWMTVLPSEPGYSRLMTLRIYWDGEKTPSVQAPIGDFFGVGHGMDVAFDSLPVRASADGKARSCIWPMPFRRSARVTVTNDGSEATWGFYYTVDWEKGAVAKDAPYFHASYRQEFPTKAGNYLIANLTGNGHYVGTVLSVRSTTPGWWGEGDDYFTIDGERSPSLKGTGLEDYFGEAWGLRKVSSAYSGGSVWEGGFNGARTTAYRWHVPDPVRFRKSLKVEIEHIGVAEGPDGKGLGNNNERPDEYSSCAFWYQTEPHAPLPDLPPGPERLPFDYRKMIEGESLLDTAKATDGKITISKVPGLRGGGQLEWAEGKDGAELSLPFTVPSDGQYQIMLLTTHRWDGGTARFFVDDREMSGDVSFNSGGYEMHHELPLSFQKLTAGAHRLKIRVVKPAADKDRWFGIDGFIVQPLRPSPTSK